jgi:hypothetical protein
MNEKQNATRRSINRRSFVTSGLAVGAATMGAGLPLQRSLSFAEMGREEHSGRLTKGDAALLRFATAAEILETDFWVQYNELAGIQDAEVPGGIGNPAYTDALSVLDEDMAQYINAYLVSKGAATANLEQFRILPGSSATGSSGKLRLTNLTQLTVDTSWWTRYRSAIHNPDLEPSFAFLQECRHWL